MPVPLTPPYLQFLDANGAPLAYGTITTYQATTSTLKATYTDVSGATNAPNPIQLNASGIPQTGNGMIFIQGAYRIVVKDQNGNVIDDQPNITSFTNVSATDSPFFQSFSGNGSQTSFTLSTDLGTDPKALMVFVSSPSAGFFQSFSGTGSQTAFTLNTDKGTDSTSLLVFIYDSSLGDKQGYQLINPSAYTVNGTSLTFTTAPVTGANNIYVAQPTQQNTTGISGYIDPSLYTLNGTSLTFATAPVTGTNNIKVTCPSSLVGAAAASAAAADLSATASATSATASASSATAAASSATAAASSATAAASSATSASGSATTATTQASNAATSATNAATSATAAAASAAQAAGQLIGTSTTSNTIGTGSLTFTTQTGLAIAVGSFIVIANTPTPANYIHGQVTAYNSGTGSLTVNSLDSGGSGTFTAWTITLSGPSGTGNVNSGANLTNNTLIKGSNGTTGVQTTGISVDSSNNVSGVGTIASGTVSATNTSAGASVVGLGLFNRSDTNLTGIRIDLQPVNNPTSGTRSAQIEAVQNGNTNYIDLNYWNSNAGIPTKNWTMGYVGDLKAVGATAAASPAAGDVNAKRLLVNGTAVVSSPFAASYASAQTSYTNAGTFTLTHGLGGIPSLVQTTLVCQTGQASYTAGDVVLAALGGANGADYGYSATLTSTSIIVRISGNGFVLPDKTTGTETALTAANWKLVFKAWLQMASITHKKTDTIPNWTQAQLDQQIALGNYPQGTTLADIVLPSDWNDAHDFTGLQDTLVSGANIKTINGSDILGAGDLMVAATPGGSSGNVQVNISGSFYGDNNLNYDNIFKRLGIQVSNPLVPFHADSLIPQTITAPSAINYALTLDPAIDAPTSASAAMVTIGNGNTAGLSYSQVDDPSYLYTANGTTSISIYIIPYKIIQGTSYYAVYGSPITPTDNSDGQQCGFQYNWTAVDADGYILVSSGSATGGNPNWTKDVGNVTSFLDDGTISASDPIPTSFSTICFPAQNTSYADPNSGSGTFTADGSGQIANGSDWQVYVYGYASIYGQNYFSSSPYVIDLGTDPNDGNPYAASGSFTGGAYPNYVAILYIGGSPVAGQDLGGGTSFYITNGAVPSVSPAISSYAGTTWTHGAYGKIVSPSVKYSISNFSYSVNDTNPDTGFIFVHSLSGFGNATNLKIIEDAPSSRGYGNFYDGATATTIYQYNTTLGDATVTPSTIGFQATGQTVNYDFYATTSLYGTNLFSTATTEPVVYPNDSLYYVVTFSGTLPSGCTLRVNKETVGWKDYANFSTIQDDTTVSWTGSSTITPTGAYVPTGILNWDSRNLASGQPPVRIIDHSTALVPGMVMAAYYGGLGSYQAAWGYSANQNFVFDSYNHGVEIGAFGTPDYILQPTSAKFNVNGNSSLTTYFYGSGSGSPTMLFMNPNVNTAYFGNPSLNYDPFSSVAIQPYGTDTGLTFYPNPNVSPNYLMWAVNNSSSTILAAVDGNGNMSIGRGISGDARLEIEAGNSNIAQIKFKDSAALPTYTKAGTLVYTSTLNLSAGGLYLFDNALNRHQFVMSLSTGTSGEFWYSDSLGNPIAGGGLITNGSSQISIGSAYNLLIAGGAAISSNKDLTMGVNSRILGNFRPRILSSIYPRKTDRTSGLRTAQRTDAQ